MKKQVLFLGLVVSGFAAAGQNAAPTPGVKQIAYYDNEHRVLPSAARAHYRVETTFRDSAAGISRMYFASGQLKEVSPYLQVRRKVLHGPKTTWYESGQLRSREEYIGGMRHRELLVYYPDGKVRRRDVYVKGNRTQGVCYGPDGVEVPYFEYFQPPVYSQGAGDPAAVVRDMVRRGIYPERASQVEMDARVLVEFTIDAQGKVQHVSALEAKPGTITHPAVAEAFNLLRKEAVWLVEHLKPFTPARLDGEPVAAPYSIAVNFTVR